MIDRTKSVNEILRTKRQKIGPFGCYCQTLHHRVTGDGCSICNPELAKELEDDCKTKETN